jgi:hypothetical protein
MVVPPKPSEEEKYDYFKDNWLIWTTI